MIERLIRYVARIWAGETAKRYVAADANASVDADQIVRAIRSRAQRRGERSAV